MLDALAKRQTRIDRLSLVAGPERLSRDGPVYAAGPMRGQRSSRLGDMAPDLRSPNGI